MHKYQTTFYFIDGTTTVFTSGERKESLTSFTDLITSKPFNTYVDSGCSMIVNLNNVTKIFVKEVTE